MAGSVIEVRFKVCRLLSLLLIPSSPQPHPPSQVQARVRFGEEIRLSGNHPSLGCDNVDRAIPLVTSPKEFPWWWNKEGTIII
jgi:hypothetical protein